MSAKHKNGNCSKDSSAQEKACDDRIAGRAEVGSKCENDEKAGKPEPHPKLSIGDFGVHDSGIHRFTMVKRAFRHLDDAVGRAGDNGVVFPEVAGVRDRPGKLLGSNNSRQPRDDLIPLPLRHDRAYLPVYFGR